MPLRPLAALGLAGAVLAAAAPQASAAPVCRTVRVGATTVLELCLTAEVGGTGTVRTATVGFTCRAIVTVDPDDPCAGFTASLGPTGAGLGGDSQAPDIDLKSGSVRFYPTTVGPVFVDGRVEYVTVPGFCVGEPSFCD